MMDQHGKCLTFGLFLIILNCVFFLPNLLLCTHKVVILIHASIANRSVKDAIWMIKMYTCFNFFEDGLFLPLRYYVWPFLLIFFLLLITIILEVMFDSS